MEEQPFSPETVRFIGENKDGDVRRLALGKVPQGVDMAVALQQIEGYQLARRKLPAWAAREGIIFPPRLALEQCSSEATARLKREMARQLLQGEAQRMTDLTGGFGIDCSYLATLFEEVDYVERQTLLCDLARHNFETMGQHHITVHNDEAEHFLEQMTKTDLVFIDPARRDSNGRKTVTLADCSPNLEALAPQILKKSRFVMAKLSPMLDITQARRELKQMREVHIVSMDGECKEMTIILDQTCQTPHPAICCDMINGDDCKTVVFDPEEEKHIVPEYAETVGRYLYEPDAAIQKAGAFKSVAKRYRTKALSASSHLYTADDAVTDFPGRSFRVTGTCGFGKEDLRHLRAETPRANISIRNFPASAADLHHRLKIGDGGDTYLFATTLANGDKVLVKCMKTEDK